MIYGFISSLDDETTKVFFRSKKIRGNNIYCAGSLGELTSVLITLFIQGEKDEAPTKIQKEAYISFINKKMILMSEIEEKVFEYYQTVCAE